MEENITLPEEETVDSAPVTVCDIHFRTNTKTYFFDPSDISVKPGDHVIIETSRGPEFGYCSAAAHQVPASAIVAPLRKVLRLATEKDEYLNEDNRRLEKSALKFCQEKVEKLGLDMQLVSCEVAFDGSKILFYFTADGRVDFRELVRVLASNFHTRVELRQIGVRDKAKMIGGLGICGRPFCCGQFLNDFAPVSIKMAKTQNLSLNPTKISGTCGRLMCCLKYEQEAYEDLLKTSPKAESFVDTPAGRGTVTDVNLMGQRVKVRLEKDPDELVSFRNEEIAVFRNGKPKKTDEPIPDDWAPISGNKPAAPPVEEYPRFARVPVLRSEAAPAEAAKPRRQRKEKKPAESARQPLSTEPVKQTPAEQPDPAKKRRTRGGKNHKKPNQKETPSASAAKQPVKADNPPVEKTRAEKAHPQKSEKPAKTSQPKPEKAPDNATGEAPKKKKRYYYHRNKKS